LREHEIAHLETSMTAISDKYAALDGAAGFLGAALTPEMPASNGGMKQDFQGGSIYWHPAIGAFEVQGLIRARWLALGGEGSQCGYPMTDETTALDGVGRFNDFQGASFYWHPLTDAFEVHGRIRDRWRALGGEMSKLGYPVSNELSTPDGGGRYNHFQNGSIFWTGSTGAWEVIGATRARWAALRWEQGLLGYPISAPAMEVRNRVTFEIAQFLGGRIESNLATGRVLVDKLPSNQAPNYTVPIVAYRVADDDGGRACAITIEGVQQWVDEANLIFSAAGVRFVFDGVLRDMNDTKVNNLTGEDDPNWIYARDKLNELATTHRSVVVVHRAEVGGGFSWTTYDFVAMSFFDAVNPNALSILAHELGHHFGLPHTHGRDFQSVADAENYVLSGWDTEELDGDRSVIRDTAPDPYVTALHNQIGVAALQLAGRPFALQRKNIMSYWDHGGQGELTHDQIDRVRQVVLERRCRYLDVKETAPVGCGPVLAELKAMQDRLAELIADRDAATDRAERQRIAAAIATLSNRIAQATSRANAMGSL